jgi:hypothetical protein
MKAIGTSLLIMLAILAASCRKDEVVGNVRVVPRDDPQSVAPINPCSLLSREEVAMVLNQTVSNAELNAAPRPNCRYSVGEGSVTLFVFQNEGAKVGFELGKTAQDANTQPVTGVGDQAYWSPSIKTLNVLKGEIYFTVQFYGVTAGSLETMKTLAQRVASRLPGSPRGKSAVVYEERLGIAVNVY